MSHRSVQGLAGLWSALALGVRFGVEVVIDWWRGLPQESCALKGWELGQGRCSTGAQPWEARLSSLLGLGSRKATNESGRPWSASLPISTSKSTKLPLAEAQLDVVRCLVAFGASLGWVSIGLRSEWPYIVFWLP